MQEQKSTNKNRKTIRAAVLSLAIIAALAAGATAFAAYQRSLRGLVVQPEPVEGTAAAEASEGAGPHWDPFSGGSFISLQGYADSPEKRAMEEWSRFLSGYDTDGAKLAAVGNGPTGLDERYGAYGVYTQEMADALDAIAEKYGLTLHTAFYISRRPSSARISVASSANSRCPPTGTP